ncbi:MAG: alpha,alpha-trehalase, partial [Proteobacteria bacterium]|nr:alpha,alpha-trehalase [Pseudomonadota bacterium]
IGFIPNGNRTYFCTRSQPPFFAQMVTLLAEVGEDESVCERFLPQLKREYAFWMAGAGELDPATPARRRVVMSPGGLLNRYWDDAATPRQESYAEDVELAARVSRDSAQLYRDVRAGAESGWDYSPRWFGDRRSMETIRTTEVVPVDLNCLMWNLESTLATICRRAGESAEADAFEARAGTRRELLQSLFFDEASGLFMDLDLSSFAVTGTASLASAYPLYFGIATPDQAGLAARRIDEDFLKAGGWVTSNYDSGQQWDSPNGWAPLQWIAYRGLERYGFRKEARTGARRWVANNLAVYEKHGCLLEKYNVVSSGTAGSGGEYEVQEGFGWTNAVLLRLMRELSR